VKETKKIFNDIICSSSNFVIRDQLEIALRASLFNLENNVPNIFMHNNWGKAREAWLKAVRESCLTRDFTRALTALVCFMKPCLLLNVWHEALGHTSLKKIVGQLKGIFTNLLSTLN